MTDPVDRQPTERHFEILPLIAEGMTNAEIGEKLFITEDTVKTHVRRLSKMWSARNRAQLVHIAYQRGFFDTPADWPQPRPLAPPPVARRHQPGALFERRGLIYRAIPQPA